MYGGGDQMGHEMVWAHNELMMLGAEDILWRTAGK